MVHCQVLVIGGDTGPEYIGRVDRRFCFTGCDYRVQLFKGQLVLNPGFFFFVQEHFLG